MANATSSAAMRAAESYQNESIDQPKSRKTVSRAKVATQPIAAPTSSATPKTTAASRSRAFIST